MERLEIDISEIFMVIAKKVADVLKISAQRLFSHEGSPIKKIELVAIVDSSGIRVEVFGGGITRAFSIKNP